MQHWLQAPAGQYVLAWEQAQLDAAVANAFGFHALQLGFPELDGLRANRMAHRWLAVSQLSLQAGVSDRSDRIPEGILERMSERIPDVVTDFAALPFPANSLDLVILPHTLERATDPHGVLREVARVLVPEGVAVLTGFNPVSLWGLREARVPRRRWLPRAPSAEVMEFIGSLRLRDWLGLLSLEVRAEHFGCYRPMCSSMSWLRRLAWMDRAGERWWPILGAVYCLVAVKRVRGMTLLQPGWKPAVSLVGARAVSRNGVRAVQTAGREPCSQESQGMIR
ncbi:class I SAM-dependent methyltransferase [Candidatus Symbiobacter mobilis]|uniref:SAM-dependent methyltransferase n=1 Tax=Candidatus Symbiobacter mobilis CR TaxID=946483 RepID=U5N805_9BURK|nr:methyltransferase domain-containing protein [Candidatus Symbiobacter mobilis]AGX87691.1 SAM-dependent methyltransferase [Candidatus Symbiobacter mobilis CR]